MLLLELTHLYCYLLQCNEQDRVNGLDTFQLLLEESTANRAACVRAGLLSLLLEWFAKETDVALIVKFGRLMQMIGGHSISGKDMRSIFALLRSSKDGLRPRHGTLLLQIFQGMLKEQGPAVFFDLSGRDSVSNFHLQSNSPACSYSTTTFRCNHVS